MHHPQPSSVRIRPERPADAAAIAGLIERAFAGVPHSSHTEHAIVRELRRAGALAVSLVAEREGALVGHIAFSRVAVEDGTANWYGLGPLAVEPRFQRQGIGAALVRAGLSELRGLGAAGCVVLGDPSYYGRFGFGHVPLLTYPGPPPECFMAAVFAGAVPRGTVAYHAAFGRGA